MAETKAGEGKEAHSEAKNRIRITEYLDLDIDAERWRRQRALHSNLPDADDGAE